MSALLVIPTSWYVHFRSETCCVLVAALYLSLSSVFEVAVSLYLSLSCLCVIEFVASLYFLLVVSLCLSWLCIYI